MGVKQKKRFNAYGKVSNVNREKEKVKDHCQNEGTSALKLFSETKRVKKRVLKILGLGQRYHADSNRFN